ncbi:uncharacterized protein K460DRAFT_400185 [Cucurbitaria berberidis CBS 394.84]|uniref:Uncharacterized protein n=1 Tax=Cucurbitaria berberidis CBS 394.84 TaxID=1168544 RepID=A0A9P4LDH2_9PLEO|nr:uncharacterized protein K460DRAFT_400185 [Cucurbitaria berberidis CBS 394.84]KAF1850099.1 hypothetical protein K460DRAFT_400185 [Cucurbitaria berberidis CBS 394.84]
MTSKAKMPGLGYHQDPASSPRDLNEIVARYSSSALRSSSAISERRPYEVLPREVAGDDNVAPLSSSPPPYVSSIYRFPLTFQHRRSSTHSGYLSRDQLFGRSPTPEPESSPLPQPEALQRIDLQRCVSRQSPKADPLISSLERRQQENDITLQDRPSLPNLRVKQKESISTSDLCSSLRGGRTSAFSLRQRFSGSPRDEWLEAGTPGPVTTDSGIEPSFMSRSTVAPTFETRNGTGGAYIKDGKSFKVSPAETALHKALKKVAHPEKTDPTRSASWSRTVFHRHDPQYEFPKAKTLYESLLELDSVKSQASPELLADVTSSHKAVKALDEKKYIKPSHKNSPVNETVDLDGSYVDLQTAYGVAGLRATIFSGSNNFEKISVLPPREVFSQEPIGLASQNLLSAVPRGNSTCRRKIPSLRVTPTLIIFDQSPLPPKYEISLATPTVIISNHPIHPPCYGFSSKEVTVYPSPMTPSQQQRLSFSDSNIAIIRGCISFAVILNVLLNIGKGIRAVQITYDISIAFMIGMSLCLVLNWVRGGRFIVPGGLLRSREHVHNTE